MNPDFSDPVLLLPLGVFGLVFGSFATALSYRLPRGESIAHGRSRCPACGHTLTAPDLVPVLSWMVQGGACRHCRTKISGRYPVIEAATMGLFVAAGVLVGDFQHLLLLLAMTPLIMALVVIDLEHQRLPNVLLILLAVLAVGWRWVGDQALVAGLLTAGAAGIVGLGLDAAFKAVTGKGALGMGDTKLFALAGLALPLGPFLLFGVLSGLFGVLFGGLWLWRFRTSRFPFSPAILTAFWLCLTLGDPMLRQLVFIQSG